MEPTNTVLLPTTVVGSYSVPEWLERRTNVKIPYAKT